MLVVGVTVFALALGVSVATMFETIGERLSRPARRVEVLHHDRASWYYPEDEQ